ncbi:hypothetical protein SASPL_127515 [Salvia splendens]|uniref:SMP-LTD domain-containing protein n=1 Tax=Salvia splendens TaxID=180675 RepID=A0A8X8XC32_SALSN|nr:hypothetical protein SASPL_127515 [Salvia splendens]
MSLNHTRHVASNQDRHVINRQLNWLNQHLDKIWPYVDQAASQVIRDSVEPIFEQYRPAILASFKFSTLTLGTVAPQFTGVAILDSDPNEIVKNIGFTGVFRLMSSHVLELFVQRNLDFTLKVIGGDLSSIPGISDAIEVLRLFCSNLYKKEFIYADR